MDGPQAPLPTLLCSGLRWAPDAPLEDSRRDLLRDEEGEHLPLLGSFRSVKRAQRFGDPLRGNQGSAPRLRCRFWAVLSSLHPLPSPVSTCWKGLPAQELRRALLHFAFLHHGQVLVDRLFYTSGEQFGLVTRSPSERGMCS